MQKYHFSCTSSQQDTCYGFAAIVLQVPRNFRAPVTISQENCYRCNMSFSDHDGNTQTRQHDKQYH